MKNLLLYLLLLQSTFTFAQSPHLPSSDGQNKDINIIKTEEGCYTTILVPAKYETVVDSILNPAWHQGNINGDLRYTTLTEQVLVKKAYKVFSTLPATFTSLNEDIILKSTSPKKINRAVVQRPAKLIEKEIPAAYRTVTKQVLIAPMIARKIPPKYMLRRTNRLVKEAYERKLSVPCD